MSKGIVLENLNEHMKGKGVLVNGTVYAINEQGLAEITKKEDAEKLLNSASWQIFDPKKAEARAARREALKRQNRGRLLGANGQPIEDATKPDQGQGEVIAAVDQHEAEAVGEANPPPSEQQEEEVVGLAEGDPPVPGEDGDWPDPTEEMSLEYLKLMADAYEIEYGARIGKEKLLERLKAEMYED